MPTDQGAVLSSSARPRLSTHLRMSYDRVRDQHVLLGPESVLVLNPTGTAILERCDGQRTVAEIVDELSAQYAHVSGDEVRKFLARLASKGLVEIGDA